MAEVSPGFHIEAPLDHITDPQLWENAVPPDLAPCADCRKEFAGRGRRRRYLRTECLRCGPRFAHASSLPVTRASYGLGRLAPCHSCAEEGRRLGSRRFGSSRLSCAACGPTLTLMAPGEPPRLQRALERTSSHLREGRAVSVLTPYGCYTLALPDAAGALRLELSNEFDPIAVVAPNLRSARAIGSLSKREADALASPQAPELSVWPLAKSHSLQRAAAPFGGDLRLRLADCFALEALAAEVGPLLCAPASRGAAFVPSTLQGASSLPSAPWLTDGMEPLDPVPSARRFFLGTHAVLLSHGRGSLPASAWAGHDATVLSYGAGRELFGAAAHGGAIHLTGGAGPSTRRDATLRARRLISRAAALSATGLATKVDAVATPAAEGESPRLAAEELAEELSVPLRECAAAHARASAAQENERRPTLVLVLESEEPAGPAESWLRTSQTGGDLIDPKARAVRGGLHPFEIVEAPGGRHDLVAPLASLFDRADIVLGASREEDAPLLEVLRTRAKKSTSAVALADALACVLNLLPRRAPIGSGFAECARHLDDPQFSRRHLFEPKLVASRGAKGLDVLDLLRQWSHARAEAMRREPHPLKAERRAALGASFLRGLLDGIAASCAAAPNAPRHIMITGSLVGCPPAARALVEAMSRHGMDAAPPRDLPILDGALPIGAARLAQ